MWTGLADDWLRPAAYHVGGLGRQGSKMFPSRPTKDIGAKKGMREGRQADGAHMTGQQAWVESWERWEKWAGGRWDEWRQVGFCDKRGSDASTFHLYRGGGFGIRWHHGISGIRDLDGRSLAVGAGVGLGVCVQVRGGGWRERRGAGGCVVAVRLEAGLVSAAVSLYHASRPSAAPTPYDPAGPRGQHQLGGGRTGCQLSSVPA